MLKNKEINKKINFYVINFAKKCQPNLVKSIAFFSKVYYDDYGVRNYAHSLRPKM